MTPGLALAIERVEAENPRPLTIQDFPQSFALLSEGYQRRDEEHREAADSAA